MHLSDEDMLNITCVCVLAGDIVSKVSRKLSGVVSARENLFCSETSDPIDSRPTTDRCSCSADFLWRP